MQHILLFVNIDLCLPVGTAWAWSMMAKATAVGMKQPWEAWWPLWCRRPSIDTTGQCAAGRSWRDTSSEFMHMHTTLQWYRQTTLCIFCRRETIAMITWVTQSSNPNISIYNLEIIWICLRINNTQSVTKYKKSVVECQSVKFRLLLMIITMLFWSYSINSISGERAITRITIIHKNCTEKITQVSLMNALKLECFLVFVPCVLYVFMPFSA